jgi:hypothetical protein
MAYGTLSTLDTLASIRQSVIAFGEDRAWQSISAALDSHNAQFNEMLGTLVERTSDARRSYGTGDVKVMDELDQWGQSDAQKISAAQTVDFPLRRYGNSLQWTRQWMISNTVEQLAAEVSAIMDADRSNLMRRSSARFTPDEYHVHRQAGRPGQRVARGQGVRQQRRLGLPGRSERRGVRDLASALSGQRDADGDGATNLVTAVQEHYNSGTPVIVINSADEAAVARAHGLRGLCGPAPHAECERQPADCTRVNFANTYNREIGLYGAAVVRIKPWAHRELRLRVHRGSGATAGHAGTAGRHAGRSEPPVRGRTAPVAGPLLRAPVRRRRVATCRRRRPGVQQRYVPDADHLSLLKGALSHG